MTASLRAKIIAILLLFTQLINAQNTTFANDAGPEIIKGPARQETCATNTNLCPRGNRKLWAVHNFIMWLCWVVFMCIIVSSARYFRHYWRRSIYIHITIGMTIFVLMTAAVFMAWSRNIPQGKSFMYWKKYSALFENVATFLAWGLAISGMIAWGWRRYGTYEWGTSKVLAIGKLHRYFG